MIYDILSLQSKRQAEKGSEMFQDFKNLLADLLSEKEKIDNECETKRRELLEKDRLFQQKLKKHEEAGDIRLHQLEAQLKENCERIKRTGD